MNDISEIEFIDQGTSVPSMKIPTDESVGAMLIDISGFQNPFADHSLLESNFGNGKLQCVHNMDEAYTLGIRNDRFLNGLLYYHLSEFYAFIGHDQEVYIALADCSEGWDIIQDMQVYASGKLFHIGVWTSQRMWSANQDGTIGFTSLIADLQKQADEVGGCIGSVTNSMVPLNMLLFANTRVEGDVQPDFRNLPDISVLGCRKTSVFLLQNGTEAVHSMQSAMPLNAPVGGLGIVMGCMAICGAEESIASVMSCDLNRNEGFGDPEWGVGADSTPIDDIPVTWTAFNSSKGYILPIAYEGREGSCYLSSDRTLSYGDYGTISNNRVLHKCRRAACTALVPNLQGNHSIDPSTGRITAAAASMLANSVYIILDSALLNKSGQSQIKNRTVDFTCDNMLDTDSLTMNLTIQPINYNSSISESISQNLG